MRLGWRASSGLGGGNALAMALWTLAGLLAAATPASADEPMFGYVNTTDLLPRGKWQLEQWATLREGDGAGRYRAIEGRSEFDYGATDNVQLTAYLNYSHLASRLTPQEAGLARASPVGRGSRTTLDSMTGEAIWRVASPYLQPVGFAVLSDVTAGQRRPIFGFKAIAQKNFRDDTLVLAANARLEVGEREVSPATFQRLSVRRIEFSLGASYRFRPNWSGAVELRHRRRHVEGGLQNSALFLGPSLHYGGERWFWTLSALMRVSSNLHRTRPDEIVSGRALLAEKARWDGVRLRVGRTF
jgi:hypothetical protein